MSAADNFYAGLTEQLQRYDGLIEHLATTDVPTGPAIRSGVERGDPFAYVRNRPMAGRITPGESERATSASLDAAGADEAVADDAHRPDAQLGVVAADTDRDDPASVEHVRQSRLSRWQRLPT